MVVGLVNQLSFFTCAVVVVVYMFSGDGLEVYFTEICGRTLQDKNSHVMCVVFNDDSL